MNLWKTDLVSTAPAYSGDFPDPFVVRLRGRYYAYATQTGNINVQVMVSTDLSRWTHLGDAMPELPRWSSPGKTWAPAVLPREHGHALFVAVRDQASGRQHIALATARRPQGPFVDTLSTPFLSQVDRGGCIDPSLFVDHDATTYLVWKTDDDALGRPARLWGARLEPDGLSLAGPSVELLRQTEDWEMPRIEGPSLTRGEEGYYLFYGGGDWTSSGYATGYAIGESPLGPFTKATREASWMSSRKAAAGPGGAELFTDVAGGLRIAYHAWHPDRVGYEAGGARSLWIGKVRFAGRHPILEP